MCSKPRHNQITPNNSRSSSNVSSYTGSSGARRPVQASNDPLLTRIKKLERQQQDSLFPEDTFSFFAVGKSTRDGREYPLFYPFLLALFVLCIQSALLFFLWDNERNSWGAYKIEQCGILEQNERSRRILLTSQVFAIFLTVVLQQELNQSLNVFSKGYDAFSNALARVVGEEFRYCIPQYLWLLSNSFRFMFGICAIIVNYYLIVTELDVRELILNFTAVQFISGIDDGVFLLIKWNYLDSCCLKPGKVAEAIASLYPASPDEESLIEHQEEQPHEESNENAQNMCCQLLCSISSSLFWMCSPKVCILIAALLFALLYFFFRTQDINEEACMCISKETAQNGFCNLGCNSEAYSYDDGDCCRLTCKNKDGYICGKDRDGFIDVGFNCEDPAAKQPWNFTRSLIGGAGSESGYSIALSNNGNVLVVGYPGTDSIGVFDLFGSEWVPRDGELPSGPRRSRFGESVAIYTNNVNAVKNPKKSPSVFVLVGMPKGDGIPSLSGTERAHGTARFDSCGTSGCTQIGDDIVPPEGKQNTNNFGKQVSLSKNGAIAAIISDDYIFTYDIGINSQSLWSNGLPKAISLNKSHCTICSLALSPSGDMLVIAAYSSDNHETLFKTYKFEGGEDQWVEIETAQTRETIKSVQINNIQGGLESHSPIALANNSKTLAIGYLWEGGAESGVRLFHWNGTAWERTCQVKTSRSPERHLSVTLSEDGSTLVVASHLEERFRKRAIDVYSYNGTTCNSLFESPIDRDPTSIALTKDGSSLAVGMPDNEGKVNIYHSKKFDASRNEMCTDMYDTLVHLSLTLDEYPEETSWYLVQNFDNGTGTLAAHESNYVQDDSLSTVVYDVCLDSSTCTIFVIYDRHGDGLWGIDGNGIYALFINFENEMEVHQGDNFGYHDMVLIGDCLNIDTCYDTVLVQKIEDDQFKQFCIQDHEANEATVPSSYNKQYKLTVDGRVIIDDLPNTSNSYDGRNDHDDILIFGHWGDSKCEDDEIRFRLSMSGGYNPKSEYWYVEEKATNTSFDERNATKHNGNGSFPEAYDLCVDNSLCYELHFNYHYYFGNSTAANDTHQYYYHIGPYIVYLNDEIAFIGGDIDIDLKVNRSRHDYFGNCSNEIL